MPDGRSDHNGEIEIVAGAFESDLADKDTDVYKAAEGLNVGDKVDLEGFLYWSNGVNPHVTGITVL